jgi:6-phosphogluconolactonase
MIEAEWWEYDSVDEMADAVAGDVGFIIESAIDARDASLLALPGGKTPVPMFKKLAAQKLAWKKVTIVPTDERLVEVSDERSNARLLAQSFMRAGARVIPIGGENDDVDAAGNIADARLQDLPWPPDLVWLGMGADGHTASIFEGPHMQKALDAPKARRAVGVMPDPIPADMPVAAGDADPRRAAVGADADHHHHRRRKRALLEQAIADGQSSKLPIGRVLAEAEQPIDIHWAP